MSKHQILTDWYFMSLAGNRARLNFNLKDYYRKADVLAAVDRIDYLGRNTNTTGGLKVARLEVFDPDYQLRPEVDQIIVLITDGVPTYDADKLDAEVAAVKRAGIRILGIGVTDKVIFVIFFCLVSSEIFALYTPRNIIIIIIIIYSLKIGAGQQGRIPGTYNCPQYKIKCRNIKYRELQKTRSQSQLSNSANSNSIVIAE